MSNPRNIIFWRFTKVVFCIQRSDLLEQIFENSTMASLENLYLRHNDLYGLPPDFFINMPNLKILDMSDNRLLR